MIGRPLLIAFVLAGSMPLAGLARAATIEVTIADLVFTPNEVRAAVGDTIHFVNKDFVDHTATAIDGQFDVDLPANGSGALVVSQAGTFDLFCRYHPDMKARIVVSANAAR